MLAILLVQAHAGVGIALQAEAVLLKDPVSSPRAYTGLTVGPRLQLSVGKEWRWHSRLSGGVGTLTPAGLHKRVYTATRTDPITGETTTRSFSPARFAAHAQLSTGLDRMLGASLVGAEVVWDADYASGVSSATWAMSSVQLRPRVGKSWKLGGWLVDASTGVDLVGMMTRYPWSANPIAPGKGLIASFFTGNRLSAPWNHLATSSTLHAGRASGWGGWLTLSAVHDWDPAPLTQVRASLALGWSK